MPEEAETTPQNMWLTGCAMRTPWGKQAETMLRAQSGRLENYPLPRGRIEQHIEETLSQQQLLEQCLDRLGSAPQR
jgi:ferritin-like metal-binding protein YciE